MNGKLITFEGCEGVGKSTQLRLLKEYLERTGQSAVFTREPGGTPIAEEIRSILLYKNFEISPVVEAYLFATARADHVNRVILPALEQGKLVVCDRYLDSSLAYQGVARGLGIDTVLAYNRYAVQTCMPDYTVFLKMDPLHSWRKQKGKTVEGDRMEQEGAAFHSAVYRGFLELEQRYPERYLTIVPQEDKLATHAAIVGALVAKRVIG